MIRIITSQLITIVSLILNGPRKGTSIGNVKNILAPVISNSILFIHLLSLAVLFSGLMKQIFVICCYFLV